MYLCVLHFPGDKICQANQNVCFILFEGSGKSLNVSTGSLKSHNSLFVPGAQQGKDLICFIYQCIV